MSQKQIIRDDAGRPLLRPCPGCTAPRVLVLTVLEPDERSRWDAEHGIVDITASVLPPAQRAAAMARSAETARLGVAMPTIACVTCGFDGLYTFGA